MSKQFMIRNLIFGLLVFSFPALANAEPQVITNSIGMKLALIPAGEFLMGSPTKEAERRPNEIQHPVKITRPFYMGMYEVTQGEFEKVSGKDRRATFNQGMADFPMETFDRGEADKFLNGLSNLAAEKQAGRRYRLPTEAEWEYACRAGTTTTFHYGDSLSAEQANFNGNFPYGNSKKGTYHRRPVKVGSYKPNAFGLYDMHGNVAECCSDWFDPEYYADSPAEDPLGPPFGVVTTDFNTFYFSVRGGSWLDDARGCRSAYRFRAMPKNRYQIIGMRVVCDVNTAK